MPLRGAKTQPGFHPFANPSPILAENQAGFHPCVSPIPYSGRKSSGGRARYAVAVLPRTAPAGGENPSGFHPFAKHFLLESYPDSGRESAAGRQNTVMWRLCAPLHGKPFGRAMPPHDGILPAVTMPDWGRMNR
ncbi:MAG: hypothetical protein LBK61_07535 [Spirochaetaceae bacterium]|nr:hypothetical protein [Spirochaetaceae bacterium]